MISLDKKNNNQNLQKNNIQGVSEKSIPRFFAPQFSPNEWFYIIN
jgi:hypothetical protein